MICPKCEYEYVKGIRMCPDCNVELVSIEDFEGNLVNPEDYVVIYTSSDQIEMEMLKSNLSGAGIESLILVQKDRSLPIVGDLAVIKLLVRRDQSEDALTIISDINNPG